MSDKLLKAIENKNVKEVEKLLKSGEDPNYYNSYAIILAVEHSQYKIIKLLIDHGLKYDNLEEEIALKMVECEEDVLQIVCFFLSRRIKIDHLVLSNIKNKYIKKIIKDSRNNQNIFKYKDEDDQ